MSEFSADKARALCQRYETTHDWCSSARAQLRAACDEVERLTRHGPLWLKCAIGKMHGLVDQTAPDDPVGIALTVAGLERWPEADIDEQWAVRATEATIRRLRARLAKLEAALDEACDIAASYIDEGGYPEERIAALRAITGEK